MSSPSNSHRREMAALPFFISTALIAMGRRSLTTISAFRMQALEAVNEAAMQSAEMNGKFSHSMKAVLGQESDGSGGPK